VALHPGGDHRSARLVLRGQVPQGLLTQHRIHHLPHRLIGTVHRRVSDLQQQQLLTGHPRELGNHLPHDLLLRPQPDPVHGGDQQPHQLVSDLLLPGHQQGGKHRHPQRPGMTPHMTRRLDQRASHPLTSHLDRHIPHEMLRQRERANSLQLGDLIQHRLEAYVPRRGLHPAQQTRILIHPGTGAGLRGLHQRQQPSPGRRLNPVIHPQRHRLARPGQRATHDPVDLLRRRRLQLPAPALRQELLTHHVPRAHTLRIVAGQPVRQLLPIGDRELTEPEEPADLRTVPLDRSPVPLIQAQIRSRHLHLRRHEVHHLPLQL
jgi:hypothetical protein